jgi:ribonucleoside-diphosphate reductase alpha chain
MGWADMLFKLKVPYDSDEAVELAQKVMGYIQEVAHDTSRQLGQERGSFPNIEQSVYRGQVMRNATCTTIAPTGTISMIAGTTSGIEPVFSLAYTKNVLDGAALLEANSVFEDYVHHNFAPEEAEDILLQVAKTGNLQQVSAIPTPIHRIFVTALEISPTWHIKMQAAFQAYCDNAVSKTVNFPVTATRQEVAEVFRLAYQLGCKGVTVYRSGSREEEVLQTGNQKQEEQLPKTKLFPGQDPKKPSALPNK